jgi:hypothetical protein
MFDERAVIIPLALMFAEDVIWPVKVCVSSAEFPN